MAAPSVTVKDKLLDINQFVRLKKSCEQCLKRQGRRNNLHKPNPTSLHYSNKYLRSDLVSSRVTQQNLLSLQQRPSYTEGPLL